MTPNATTQTEALLLTETKDGVATLTLNRPGQFNALSSALIDELQSTFEDMAREIQHIIGQMTDDERRHYLSESLFLNVVSYENERLGAMVVPAGEWIDLRRDPMGQTVKESLELADTSDIDLSVPFTVPGLNVQIGIEWSRRSQISCSTTYALPGGRRYRPSAAYGEPRDLPFWRWE